MTLICCILSCTTHIADPISWFQMQHFRSLAPDANPLPVLRQHCDQCQSLGVAHLPIMSTYVVSTLLQIL